MESLFFGSIEYVLLTLYFVFILMMTLSIFLFFPIKISKITDRESFEVFMLISCIGIGIYLIYKLVKADEFEERLLYCTMLGFIYFINLLISIIATILWIIFYRIVLYPLIKIVTLIVDKLLVKFDVKEDCKNQETVDKIWDKTTEIILKIHTKKSKRKKDEA